MARRAYLFLCLPLALGLTGCPEEDRGGRDDLQEQTAPRTEDEDTPAFPYEDGGTGTQDNTQGSQEPYGPSPTQQSGPESGSGSAGGATRSGEPRQGSDGSR